MIWASAPRLFFIRNLLNPAGEKILLMIPVNCGGDCGQDWMAEMRPFMGNDDMIREVTRDSIVCNDAPMKFEVGTPGIGQTIGLGVAIEYMIGLGMANIAAHENRLRDYARARLDFLNRITVQGAHFFLLNAGRCARA
jgi:hypothetical protein